MLIMTTAKLRLSLGKKCLLSCAYFQGLFSMSCAARISITKNRVVSHQNTQKSSKQLPLWEKARIIRNNYVGRL